MAEPLGRLWRLASWLTMPGGAPPLAAAGPYPAASASHAPLPPLTASHDLFARLRAQGWDQPLLLVGTRGRVGQALPVLRALAGKPTTSLRRWRAPDEVPLLVGLLRALAASGSPASSPLWSVEEEQEPEAEAEEEAAVLLALEILHRWATVVASPLVSDTAWAAAQAGSEASIAALTARHRHRAPSQRAAMVVHTTVRLWLFLAVRAPTATEAAVALQEAARLLLVPHSVEVLLAAGEGPWRDMLASLLFLDPAPGAVAAPIRYRAARLALDTVARAPLLWAWDALAAVVTRAAEDEDEEEAGAGEGAAGGAPPCEWRRAVVQAALDAMEGDAVCPWAGHAAGAVAAAALLAQSPATGTGAAATTTGAAVAVAAEEEDKRRLWRAFPRLTEAMAPATVEARWTATPKEEEDWRTARVGLARALMLLGLSGFCTRAVRGTGRRGGPVTAAAAAARSPSSASSSPSWVPPQEWGGLLTALLRLSLEEVVPSGASPETGNAAPRRHQTLARALCDRGLAPSASQEWARALTHMFKAAHGEAQLAALDTLRTYSRATTATTAASASLQRQGAYGAALVLQTCLVLGDPSSATVGSTEQAMRVFDILEAISGLVPLGAGAGGGATEAGGASAAALEWALLRAAGNLQAVLEEDGEEGGLRAVRDWAVRELLRGKQQYGPPNAAAAANRLAFLIHLAFALCIETRRPAPHSYVADLTKFLLDQVARPTSSGVGSTSTSSGVGRATASAAERRVQALVHKCLRKLLANPHLLAYRAGRIEHWDEARRRVTATYIGAALAGYPATTRFPDLAYSVGAALGAIPTAGDPAGQAVLLHCIGLLQDRALALIGQGDAQLQAHATVELVRLLFQTLIVCPPALLGAVLEGLARDFFLRGLRDRPEARLRALRLLKEVVFGEVETMRQARLAKWYLRLLSDEGAEAAATAATAAAAAQPHSRL
jgi:hypothetical protein